MVVVGEQSDFGFGDGNVKRPAGVSGGRSDKVAGEEQCET
jgi:hypothetical protein